jgi:hypothetical protein
MFGLMYFGILFAPIDTYKRLAAQIIDAVITFAETGEVA